MPQRLVPRVPVLWKVQVGLAKSRMVVAAILAAVLVAIAAFSVGRLTAGEEATPTSTSAAAGFSRDMQVHHDQGVEIAMLVRDRTDDPDIRLLAYDIATAQSNQSGQMLGWLSAWELPQAAPEPSMTWMTRPPITGGTDHSSMSSMSSEGEPTMLMPGLATPAQIDSLRTAKGVEAEVVFLELMIAHHTGAIEMADAVLARTNVAVVQSFALAMVTAQKSEIAAMQNLLAERQ